MRLDTDFNELKRLVDLMGPVRHAWTPDIALPELEEIDIQLREGVEITLDELDIENGLLSVQGRQILLYIPDQGRNIADALDDGIKGRRFHVADCKTLRSMRDQNRFERYVVTNDLSGNFKVHGVDIYGTDQGGITNLHVCMNCLSALNYSGYTYKTKPGRTKIHRNFSIEEFFEAYSTFFKHLPSKRINDGVSGYTDDWPLISGSIKADCHYICDECEIDLSANKHLLHVHHINGVKNDNAPDNLRPLCIDCHRKQPMHALMFVTPKNMKMISRLRRAQLDTPAEDWKELILLADRGVADLLEVLKKNAAPIPEVGLDFLDGDAVAGMLAVAWPASKVGIYTDASDADAAMALGWHVYNPLEAIEHASTIARRVR